MIRTCGLKIHFKVDYVFGLFYKDFNYDNSCTTNIIINILI